MQKSKSVAIVGMSGRMPQSENLDMFWANLEGEKDLITTIPGDRFPWEKYYGDPLREEQKTNSKWGGFLKDIRRFDAEFFKIPGAEAVWMDPQQRIMLETVWEVFEDAGYRPSDFAGTRTGVYLGVSNVEYRAYLESIPNLGTDADKMMGNNASMIAGRVSYQFDLKGPSEVIDTLCSSSNAAIHKAAEDISNGNCEQALAGAVNVILTPGLYISYANAQMLSKDGRCKVFDEKADGFVRGEGIGVLLLKPLEKAIQDRDRIYAVIRGTAVRHQGRSKSIISPNMQEQAGVIVEAIRSSGVDPGEISFIETHGSGTALGDAVEINGLKLAFQMLNQEYGTIKKHSCALGAVKSNTGHLESAAGMAGILKVLLALKNQVIPSNLHCSKISPYIDLADTPFYLADQTIPWNPLKNNSGELISRKAGISSFGAGGVISHIVLEEYFQDFYPARSDGNMIFVLSADTDERLKVSAERMVAYLLKTKDPLENIVYTSQVGREAGKFRFGCIVRSKKDLIQELDHYLKGKVHLDKSPPGDLRRINSNGLSVKEWSDTGNYQTILDKYLEGYEIRWEELYGNERYSRVSLPAYPFQKTIYWANKEGK